MLERTPQAFINACFSMMWNSGYSATIDTDLRGWVGFLANAYPDSPVNAAFNPEFHRLEADNSFWLSVRRRSDNKVIACICDRLIESDDFFEDQRQMRIWYGDPETSGVEPMDIAQPRSAFPNVRGKIGHHGGLRVDRSERHNGLAWLLCRVIRAMSMLRWPDLDWHCGTSLEDVAVRDLPRNTYGYTRVDLLLDGWFEPSQLNHKVFMTSISASEISLQIAQDLSLIEMNSQKQMRDVVLSARERQSNPPVLAAMAG